MIAQLQLARTGMLRFNMDYPCSTRALSALVKREDVEHGACGDSNDLQVWKGPYIELTNQLISSRDLNVSSIYPESRLTLREATVGNVQYQAIILEGSASSNLRAAILAQCGEDCMPIPGSDDLGILVHQSQPAAVQSSELVTQVATPRPAWIPLPPPPPPPVSPPVPWIPPSGPPAPPSAPPPPPPPQPPPPPTWTPPVLPPPLPLPPPPPPPPPPVVTPPAGPTTPVTPPTPPTPPAIPQSIPVKGNIVWGSTPSWEPMSGESQVVSKNQNGIVWYIPMGDGYIGALMECPYGYTPEIISWTGNGVTVPAQCNKT